MQAKLFISYRRDDSPGHAGRLSDAIRKSYGEGYIFKDVTNIRAGEYFPPVIKTAIEDASVIIMVIGPKWAGPKWLQRSKIFNRHDWVRKEIEIAIKASIHILPILVNGGEIPPKYQ